MSLEFEELFKQGDLSGSLTTLQGEIRKNPADPKLRLFLFQLEYLLERKKQKEMAMLLVSV